MFNKILASTLLFLNTILTGLGVNQSNKTTEIQEKSLSTTVEKEESVNADTLDNKESSYFASQDSVNNLSFNTFNIFPGVFVEGNNFTFPGSLNLSGGQLYLSPISEGSAREGVIYYDDDNDKVYVRGSSDWIDLSQQDSRINTDDLIGNPSGSIQGDILYYSANGWQRLATGTSGYFLKTQGSDANPTWSNAPTTATLVVAASDSKDTSPADYIADGTDDDVQIQAALDALPSGGGKVVLLEGNYNGGQITIPSNTTLSGMGPSTILKMTDDTDDRFIVNSDRTNGNINIVIENLYIDGNKDEQVELGPADSYGNAGALDFRNVENLVVRNNTIVNAWAAGVETTLSENVIITGNRIDDSADDGIAINDQTIYAIVSNNIITNAGLGVNYGSPAGIEIQDGSHDVSVSNNVIRNALSTGIQVSTHAGSTRCYNVEIIGNSVYASDIGIYVAGIAGSFASDITISGNSASSNTNEGIVTTSATGITISNNTAASNAGDAGIKLLTGTTHTIVNGNTVRLNSRGGITANADADYNQISNNTITDNGAASGGTQVGIVIHGDYIDIFDNVSADTGPGTQQYGIVFYSGANEGIARGNRFYGNTLASILDVGTDNVYQNNIGYVTENSGAATVASGETTIDVTHGLAITPSINDINVVPTNNLGNSTKYWLSDVGSSTFRINVDIDPGATTAIFSWQVAIY